MKGLYLGQRVSYTRSFSWQDVEAYRALSGDQGLTFASGATAGAQVPGPLLSGMISYLLGTRLPGRGTNWLKQSLGYPAAAPLDTPITATVEVVRLRPDKALVNLRTVCEDAAGNPVCEGDALVLVKDLEEAIP